MEVSGPNMDTREGASRHMNVIIAHRELRMHARSITMFTDREFFWRSNEGLDKTKKKSEAFVLYA